MMLSTSFRLSLDADAERRLLELVGEAAVAAFEGYYRDHAAEIPVDTGDLKASLTSVRNPNNVHRVIVAGGQARVTYGSRLPQAHYQAHRLPEPTAEEIAQRIRR